MRSTNSLVGRLILVLCNLAGMVDLVALPLWVGSLMQHRGLEPQQAGLLVTIYILGLFCSSLFFAPRLNNLDGRLVATLGFSTAALAFLGLAQITEFAPTALLHAVGGLGAGAGLSMTHGTIGRSANPHRLFAWAGFGTGLFAILFFVVLPGQIAAHGASALFLAIALLHMAAALAAMICFPRPDTIRPLAVGGQAVRLKLRVLAFFGVACIATNQAMIFSFIERIGNAHGFSPDQIATMLVIGGFVNLTAPVFASILDRRVSNYAIATIVIPIHALAGALAVLSPGYLPYAICAIAFVWLILFGHNFMFSLIARLDPSGRTVASTPAMLMIGAAIGPLLGGTLAGLFGYQSLAAAAAVIAIGGCGCFLMIWRAQHRVADGSAPIASAMQKI